ncbi:TetR/AcrR family transcriptional regulator [Gryllotalpicola reticulitermitis]|uniref:TetR/AcrR family transcriptional regulator n=1 Tax=Gryllotalpicola reticulitermitis TaxID=1184153 RepID=A0ABV8Q378_9MICO
MLSAAREIFESDGVLAPLNGIAVRAGIGNATLYRNFPTREDLLAAVVETSVEDAVVKAEELATALAPRDALAEWLTELAWRLRIWHDLPYCVAAAHGDADAPLSSAYAPILQQTARLLRNAQDAGCATSEITAEELFELVTTLSWGIDRFGDDEEAARRRTGIATAGVFL